MNHLAKYLLPIIIALFASCRASHKLVVPGTLATLPTDEQGKYEYYYLEAIRLEQQSRYDEAFEMFNHCLAIDSAPSALHKVANYYFFLNQKEKAIDALLRTVETEPGNYWYWQTLTSYYQTILEYDKAIATLETMQQQFPKRNGELLPTLIGLYSQAQQYDKVIDALERLEELAGKSESISMEKCRNYLLMGDKEGAFTEMEALANEYPENIYYRVILAEVYMNHERIAEAEAILQTILTEEPDNGPAKIALSQCYKLQADTIQYLAMIEASVMSPNVDEDTKGKMLIRLIAEDTDSTFVMGLFERILEQPQQSARLGDLCVQYMYGRLHQPEERVRPILLRMLEIEPDHVAARLQLIAYAAQHDNIEEIIKICSDGIAYRPEVIEFYYYKAMGLYHTGNHKEALDTHQKATEQITPKSDPQLVADVYAAMGDLYQELGQSDKAYHSYDTALYYNPSNLLILNNYAYHLSVNRQQLDKAEQMSMRTIKAEPNNATYLDTYAWILYQQGEYSNALVYIEQALNVEENPSDVLYEHAGDICYRLGNMEQAVEYWKLALEIQRKRHSVNKDLEKKIKNQRL